MAKDARRKDDSGETPSGPGISVRNLRVNYGEREILHCISFDVPAGETLVILGGSGSGKSALLRPAGGTGWRLRSDAEAMRLAPGLVYEDAAPRTAQVLLLTGLASPTDGARVRWRLSRDEG